MGYVYKITNTVNNKAYIGISIHEPEKGRIKVHLSGYGNRIIARAVEKYGKDAFTYEILEANVFDEFLPDLEVAYIEKFNAVHPHGYNLTRGGTHVTHTAATRRKISEANKDRKLSAEHRRKISEANKGKTPSADTRRKLSEALRGEKSPNFGKKLPTNTRRKLSNAHKGKTLSESHRRKLSEAGKGKTPSADTRRKLSEAGRGRTHTVAARRKMSEAKKGKMRNPAYNRVHAFYLKLPKDMPIPAKIRCIHLEFPNLAYSAPYRWIGEWESDRKTSHNLEP